ncbi:MAG: (2Fe-2S)-binding protein [Anaerolineae bacterium]|nr:(2Fe-2S)-binding protein [Anaerolineae bacterium]
MPEYTITVNGQAMTVNASADMPLLWVLRDRLHLTGTKYSCGKGLCGSCTVHLDGEAARSCVTPIDAVGDQAVTTIEGLSAGGSHPVQRAWLAENVPQCGYCQPGQIMAATALLASSPAPTAEEINTAMAGILCRCGTYQRIRTAIQRVIDEGGVA